jgi:DNA-3-methyladenine glycosylase
VSPLPDPCPDSPPGSPPLPRAFFDRPVLQVAADLLGRVVTTRTAEGLVAVRLTEVEAYDGPGDPGSHAYRGRTARNAVMFGPPGHVYVYFTYGMHHCANVVTGSEHDGQAVLLRAVVPCAGIDAMRSRRRPRTDRELADGPGKLCQAFGIDRSHDGVDLCTSAGVRIVDDGTPPPLNPLVGVRVGIRHGVEHPWRWRSPPL